MVNSTRWCLSGCGKSVVHSPDFPEKKDKRPFKCFRCGRKHSHKELNIENRRYSNRDGVKSNPRVYYLAKMLRSRCVDTRVKDASS